MLLTTSAAGVFPIAPTPFDEDGKVDRASIDSLIAAYRDAGAAGVTVLGIMGEAPKLEPAEALEIAAQFIDGMQLPVVVGVSAPGFAAMRTLARAAMERGAAAVMIAPPPHLRTDDQVAGYYRQAAEAIGNDIPFVVQDYPLTLSVQMAPTVIRRIVEENPSCVMLKHEDWPGLEKITTLRRFQAEKTMRPIAILVGNGGTFLDFELERGVDGSMTGYPFHEMLVECVALHKAGNRDAAHDLFDAHLPLMRYELQPGVGLAVRKYVLVRRGLIRFETQRAPWPQLTDTGRREVDYLLERVERRTGMAIRWRGKSP